MRFASPEEGWIETYNIGAGSALIQVKATHDGGQSWQSVVIEGPHAEIWDSTHLCSICEDSFYYDPLRVILGLGDMGSMNPSGKVSLSTSLDLGKTWDDITIPLPSAFRNYLISSRPPTFFNQYDGLLPVQLVTTDGSFIHNLAFYMTSDGGKSWKGGSKVLENFDRCDIKTAFVSPHDIFVGCGNNLYISNDGAKSWRTLSVNPEPGVQAYITQLDFVSANNGWIILTTDTNSTILIITTDGGKTWTVLNPKIERP